MLVSKHGAAYVATELLNRLNMAALNYTPT